MNRHRLFAVCAAVLVAAACPGAFAVQAWAATPRVEAAVASPERTDAMKARDGGRKPAAVFDLAGLAEGQKVIELASFGLYDTTMIANVVGPRGHVYMYDLPYLRARAEAPGAAFVAAHPNTSYVIGKFDELTFPAGVDLVTIDMYYHDLTLNQVDPAVLNRKLFEALKAGGRLLIVDHNAEPGSGRRDTQSLHRIDPQVIKSELTAAGFRLSVDSNLFANPTDDRSKRVFEPGERGGTDRSVFVFQKPR